MTSFFFGGGGGGGGLEFLMQDTILKCGLLNILLLEITCIKQNGYK